MRSMFFDGEWAKLRWWEFAPLVFFYVVWFSVRGLVRDRGMVLTGSLAFTTALAVVPLISVAFWGLLTFGDFNDGLVLEPYLQQVFPASTPEIVEYLANFARTSASEVAGFGALAFYAIAFFLYLSVERAFNVIWASHRRRPVAQQLGAFVLIMTFGPLLLSASFGMTGYAAIRMEQFNIDPGVVFVLVPFVLAFLTFTAMNHFLPTTRVHAWASILAGAFTAAAFELGKHGFNLYVTELVLVPYAQVYGALGLFPLFLIWLYVIWIVVLFGAELAYTAQNLRTVVRVEQGSKRAGVAGEHVFNPTIGLELYAPIARAFKRGGGRFTDRDLVAHTGYPESVVRAVVGELARIGTLEIVDEGEGERRLIPSKQLDDIDMWPMLAAFIDFHAPTDVEPVRELHAAYHMASVNVLHGRNALAFVTDEEATTVAPRARATAERPRTQHRRTAAVAVDDDSFEPIIDAAPVRSRTLEERARSLRNTSLDASVDVPPAIEEAIRVDTQDILVADEEEDVAAAVDTAVTADEPPRKPETSMTIDFDTMWDDFEVDGYEDALAEASKGSELFAPDDEEDDVVEEGEDGDEADDEEGTRVSPPPMPKLPD